VTACIAVISCASGQKKSVTYTLNKEPGPEYQLLGTIRIGNYPVPDETGSKLVSSSMFGGMDKEHLISLMVDHAMTAGGDFLVIDSIKETGEKDQIRFAGIGRVFTLKESYGKAGFIILSDKGHAVQYVMRMEPGKDYEAMRSVDKPSVKTGTKGELTVTGKTSDEAIIVLRNSAAEIGGSLVVVDEINKVASGNTESYTAKGRIFKLKTQ
jgi:hypothetical protein